MDIKEQARTLWEDVNSRLNNSFFIAFTLSWIIQNYDIVVLLLYNTKSESRLLLNLDHVIENKSIYKLLIIPISCAAFLSAIFPWLTAIFDWIKTMAEKWLNNEKAKIKGGELIEKINYYKIESEFTTIKEELLKLKTNEFNLMAELNSYKEKFNEQVKINKSYEEELLKVNSLNGNIFKTLQEANSDNLNLNIRVSGLNEYLKLQHDNINELVHTLIEFVDNNALSLENIYNELSLTIQKDLTNYFNLNKIGIPQKLILTMLNYSKVISTNIYYVEEKQNYLLRVNRKLELPTYNEFINMINQV